MNLAPSPVLREIARQQQAELAQAEAQIALLERQLAQEVSGALNYKSAPFGADASAKLVWFGSLCAKKTEEAEARYLAAHPHVRGARSRPHQGPLT